MAVVPFQSSASGSFTSQPLATGEKLILRSSSAADTMNCTIIGYVGGVVTSEVIALAGTTAVQTTNTFTSVTQLYLASAPAGQVVILRQGQKATGSISFPANVADGDTSTVAGVVYTFKSPEVSTCTTIADVASATSGRYFDAQDKNGPVRCWNNVDGVGVAPATPGGGRLLPVVYATGDSANTIATAIAAAFDADAQFESSASTNVVTIWDAALGNRTDIAVGTSTFAVAKVTDGALNNVANRVRMGLNRFYTTKSQASAILLTGTGGDNWGTGTVINPIYSAYQDGAFTSQTWNGTSDMVEYIIDKLAVNRNGTFPISDSTTNINSVSPTGGSDGLLVVSLTSAGYQITTAMTLYSPDLLTDTLLALTVPTCDPIYLAGRQCTLHIRAANITSAVVVHLESADVIGTWANRSASFAITNMDNNQQWLQITDHLEYIRVVVDTNANTTDSVIHLVAVF